ncbi:serine hydrolase [Plantactinospora sp. WMMB782]|uniref:serine hydrolase n=1 Tax=Plantactinospora sp. WMMB782 TaxID=3404121 RepID=UPI003B95E3F3
MRPRVALVLAITTVVLGGLLLVPAAYARLVDSGGPSPSGEAPVGIEPSAPPAPTLAAAPVTVKGVDGFFGWALLDRESGTISGSKNMTATNSTESMIKVWIVSDYLRRLGGRQPPPSLLKAASTAIRDSNDDATNALYKAAGGTSTLDRLVKMCGLTDTRKVVPPGERGVWWSYTAMSPRDAVRMGECVKDGTAAGPKWTEWVLDEMTKVRGSTAAKDQKAKQGGGRWGIIDGLSEGILAQGPVAIKNGWTLIFADGKWHLNCLAITDKWVLSVMTRYSGRKGLDYGADVCASVASQLTTTQPGAVLRVPVPLTARS